MKLCHETLFRRKAKLKIKILKVCNFFYLRWVFKIKSTYYKKIFLLKVVLYMSTLRVLWCPAAEQNRFNLFLFFFFLNSIQWSRESFRKSPDVEKGIFFRKKFLYVVWECDNCSRKHLSKIMRIIPIKYCNFCTKLSSKRIWKKTVFTVNVTKLKKQKPRKQPGNPKTFTSVIEKKIF